ncbi:hypothetical protein [Brevundimonas sp.]|uniref:hypothetical protein n=1 Tax=Brevundimonas sp. TaxID=1871086 RepID=UPI002D2DC297|nr:hypothetical protein [Brevundimonas sp.]HYC74520.1 hypothetical protein [Brevundimonas sp.]
MLRSLLIAASALAAVSVAAFAPASPPQEPSSYASALADPVRPAEDRARDEARHTAETLAFAQVRPGQKIADMIIGGGYFTRVFSAAVGPEGRVTRLAAGRVHRLPGQLRREPDRGRRPAQCGRHQVADRRA